MTTKQYLAALHKLKLQPYAKHTAKVLGLSERQCKRLAVGAPIPGPVALLLAMYLEHGLPAQDEA